MAVPHSPRLNALRDAMEKTGPGQVICRTCGLAVGGEVIAGECARCIRVRALWAERHQPRPSFGG